MCDRERIREKLNEMRALVKAGRERISTHSPVWAVYLAGETFRSLAKAIDDLDALARPVPGRMESGDRRRKTG